MEERRDFIVVSRNKSRPDYALCPGIDSPGRAAELAAQAGLCLGEVEVYEVTGGKWEFNVSKRETFSATPTSVDRAGRPLRRDMGAQEASPERAASEETLASLGIE